MLNSSQELTLIAEPTVIPFGDVLANIQECAEKLNVEMSFPPKSLYLRTNSTNYFLCISEQQQYFHSLVGYPKITTILKLLSPKKKTPNHIQIETGIDLFKIVGWTQDISVTPLMRTVDDNGKKKKVLYAYRLTFSDNSQAMHYINSAMRLFVKGYQSSEPSFGCCHRYKECSSAKKCLHPNLLYSTSCVYRHNLENNRIFY